MKKHQLFLFIVCLILLFFQTATAQTTGKIAGTVYDQNTKEPAIGANVFLENTALGTTVSMDGSFFIINVPPGTYTMIVQMIGYETVRIEDLRVSVNRTASVETFLKPSVVEGSVIVVRAEKIATKKDQTSSMRTVSAEQMEVLPIESVGQVVAMQAGVVNGHFRGGRYNEVSYLIDGLPVDDSFNRSGRMVDLETNSVQDLEVITGTFNAEYGRAMSGIVNAVTREGGSRISGSVSAGVANYFTTHKDIFIGLKDSEFNRNKDYSVDLSGPIFKERLTFFTNLRYQDNKNHLNGIQRFNVGDFSDFSADNQNLWISQHTGTNKYVPMNNSKNISFMGKLAYKMSGDIKLSLLYTLNDDEWHGYDHAFKYDPDGRAASYRNTDMLSLELNHMLSTSAFYELKLSYVENYNGWYLYKNPLDARYIHDGYLRSNDLTGFYTGGQQKGHSERTMRDVNAKFDLTWQINKSHSIKSGWQFINHVVDNQWEEVRNIYYGTDAESDLSLYIPIVYADSSQYSDIYTVKPYEFAGYLQDKMEYQDLVINLGLRFDYFNPNTYYPSDRRNPANRLEFADSLNRMSTYPKADPQIQLSPRFGLAYQLGGKAVLHFSYGHFFQMPPMENLYQNHSFDLGSADYATTMGNSQLKSQKTVQYEIGLWQEIIKDMGLEISLYYRDIYDLLSTKFIATYNQVVYGLYTNLDYGNVKGLEVKYDFRVGPVPININYTLQYTRGNSDTPLQNFNRAGNNADPVNVLIPMSWDQRHTLNATVGYYQRNYGATLTGYYNSGSPYTWSSITENIQTYINLLPNNDYRPSRFSLDLNAYYDFNLYKNFRGRLTLLVYNLLDRLNEESVNSQTGRAYTAIVQEVDLAGHRSDFNTYYDRIQNPAMYSSPRMIKLLMSVSFN
jgi:outer membrane receptor for ferrienterochelin and colicin